jgi:hypothetical protein
MFGVDVLLYMHKLDYSRSWGQHALAPSESIGMMGEKIAAVLGGSDSIANEWEVMWYGRSVDYRRSCDLGDCLLIKEAQRSQL